jgi:hypothetical protein
VEQSSSSSGSSSGFMTSGACILLSLKMSWSIAILTLSVVGASAVNYGPAALKDEIHALPGVPAGLNFRYFSG